MEDGKDDPKIVGADGIFGTSPVGSFKPNAMGFYDLGGNVWAWTWDGWEEKSEMRTLRGSSWRDGNRYNRARSTHRLLIPSGNVAFHMGLRLVRRAGS